MCHQITSISMLAHQMEQIVSVSKTLFKDTLHVETLVKET